MTSAREWLARLMDSNIPVYNTFLELESRKELRTFVEQVDGTREEFSKEEFSQVVRNLMGFVNYLRKYEKAPEKRWRACLDSFVVCARRTREKCRDRFSSSLCQDVVKFLEEVNEYRQASYLAYDYLRDQLRIDSSFHLVYTFSWSFPHQLESCVKRGDHAEAVKFADLLFSFVQRGQGDDRSTQALVAYAWFTVLNMPGQAADCLELILEPPSKTKTTEWLHSRSAGRWNQAIHLYQLAGNTQKAIQLCETSGREAKAQRLAGKQAYAIEEIEFPRGQNRKLAVATILDDYAMKAEACLAAGQIEEARVVSQDFATAYHRGGRATRLEEILLRHGMRDEADKISQVRAAWSCEEVTKCLTMKHDLANLYDYYDYQEPELGTQVGVFRALEDDGEYEILLDIIRSPRSRNYSWPGKQRPVCEGRALYHLGCKLEAAQVAERRWCPDEVPPKIDSSDVYEAGSETYYNFWFYLHQLGVASMYEEAGDYAAATAFLQRTERKWRQQGRWQVLLGLYFDLGRLKDLERVAREEDELECAIIAYEAANLPEEAARIYDEIVGPTKGGIKGEAKKTRSAQSHSKVEETSFKETSGDMVCPQCGAQVKANWVECPECGASLKETVCQNCGEPLEPNWKRCPACLTAVAGSG